MDLNLAPIKKIENHFQNWSLLSVEERKKQIQERKNHVSVFSEYGNLKKILLHAPGLEVERMSPENIEKFLFNGIVHQKKIEKGFFEFKSILSLVAKVYELKSVLSDLFTYEELKHKILKKILFLENKENLFSELSSCNAQELSQVLISGYQVNPKSLEDYLIEDDFALNPLPNTYFMRDTSVIVGNFVTTTRMTHACRSRETYLLKSIFEYHPDFLNCGQIIDEKIHSKDPQYCIEGGDIAVASKDIIIIGKSERTSAKAIDEFIDGYYKKRLEIGDKTPFDIIAVMVPPEKNMIHLDMIFSITGPNHAVIYEPYILGKHKVRVVRIHVNSHGEKKFHDEPGLLECLKKLKMNLSPIFCGGNSPLYQTREQWTSGSNIFAFGPNRVLSYENEHTLKNFEKEGFAVYSAEQVLKSTQLLNSEMIVVSFDGSELARGGGGPRCMTCPLQRE